MRAADHARVWEEAGNRLDKCADVARKAGSHNEETAARANGLLCMFVALAYREEAERNPE